MTTKRAINNKRHADKKRKAASLRKLYDLSDTTKEHIKTFCDDHGYYMTTANMAEIFGVSENTIREIIKENT